MIPFFRQLRQNLLYENRISKYLLYAIGEILLVVIGILIALQVDNWNTQNKQALELRESLLNLQDELDENIEYLEDEIIDFDTELSELESAIKSFNDLSDNEHSLSEINGVLFRFQRVAFVPLRENAYRKLIESGTVDFIANDSLKRELIRMEYAFSYFEREKLSMERDYETTFKPYYMQYVDLLSISDTLLFNEPLKSNPSRTDQSAFINNRMFTNLLILRLSSKRRAKNIFTDLSEVLTQINASIRTYLKSS